MEYIFTLWIYFTFNTRLFSEKYIYFPHSWLITGFVTRFTRRVPLVEQGQFTFSKHLSSPPVFRVVRGPIFSFMCMFWRSVFVLLYLFSWSLCCLFIFDIQILITSLWYLQTLLLLWKNVLRVSVVYITEVDSWIMLLQKHIIST